MKCYTEVERGVTIISGKHYFTQCNRKAIVERDGKWYCFQHDPIKVEERLIKSVERSNLKRAWKRRMRARFGN